MILVQGKIVDKAETGVSGAIVNIRNRSGVSDVAGNFSVSVIVSDEGKIIVTAQKLINGHRNLEHSDSMTAIVDGATMLGVILIRRGEFLTYSGNLTFGSDGNVPYGVNSMLNAKSSSTGIKLTYRVVLYPDGGIEFIYRELHLDGYNYNTMTGLSPGTGVMEGPKDLSLDSTFTLSTGSGVYENFSDSPFHPFDLALSNLSFEVNASGGYDYKFNALPDQAPAVSILSPATGTRIAITAPVNVTVQASDDIEIKLIEVLLDGVVKTEATQFSSRYLNVQTLYNLSFEAPPQDSAILKIRATDVRGHVTVSDSIILHFFP